MEDVIETCVSMKADIVADDEQDRGRRRLLNLGHTFGHAVESRSGYSLTHGEAVAIGVAMICRAAVRFSLLDEASKDAVLQLLKRFGLPTQTVYHPEELYGTLLLDKKFDSGILHLIVPRGIGWCEQLALAPEELRQWLEAGYES